MSLLTIIQNVCDNVGIPRPTSVIGSNVTSVRQLLRFANLEGQAQARYYPWEALVKEATHTTIAAELQGTLDSIASGFNYDMSMTYWNRSKNHRLTRIDAQEWQLRKSSGIEGIYSDYRIRNKSLYMIPAPVAGETVAFEYVSKNWCEDASGTDQNAWGADDDAGILDEYLIELGVIYRWLRAKRLDYAEEMREYNVQLNLAIARDGGNKPVLSLDNEDYLSRPSGIIVPDGNWNL